jgi:RNA recognition motif-containing protein
MYNNHSAINAEIMENQNKFQGLKNLHQNLHSRKGLTNINSADNAFCIDSKQTVYAGNNFPVDVQETEGKERNPVKETNNLLKAVKSVYVDNNVELSQPKIFVGNISYKLSTSQLKEFFSGFGRVIYAQIVKDRVKKRSKGYGFVTFSNESEVQRVLEAEDDELILDGR